MGERLSVGAEGLLIGAGEALDVLLLGLLLALLGEL